MAEPSPAASRTRTAARSIPSILRVTVVRKVRERERGASLLIPIRHDLISMFGSRSVDWAGPCGITPVCGGLEGAILGLWGPQRGAVGWWWRGDDVTTLSMRDTIRIVQLAQGKRNAAADVGRVPVRHAIRRRHALHLCRLAASSDERSTGPEPLDGNAPRPNTRMTQGNRTVRAAMANVGAAHSPVERRNIRYWRQTPLIQPHVNPVFHFLQHHAEQAGVLKEKRRPLPQAYSVPDLNLK